MRSQQPENGRGGTHGHRRSGCGYGAGFPRRGCLRCRQAGESGEQRLGSAAERATGVEIRQEVLHGQQRMDFLSGEPQTGQFILWADTLAGLFESVAAQFAVEDQWCIQSVAHVGDIAL